MSFEQPPFGTRIVNLMTWLTTAPWQQWFQKVQGLLGQLNASGPSSARPTDDLYTGQPFFDQTLGVPVWWNGSAWVSAAPGGAVANVTATSPITSTGGITPNIAIPAAGAASSGYLSNADWLRFNAGSGGGVASVSGVAPITSTGGLNPAIGIPAANGSTNGYLTATDWTRFNGGASVTPSYKGTPYPGAISRPISDMMGDYVTVTDFGADDTGANATATTAAFQAALNTGRHIYVPTGTYAINSPLTFPIAIKGQMMSGDGRVRSVLIAQPGLTGAGVLVSTGEEGPIIRDLAITCVQVDTNNRASLNVYPPAISFVNCPRFTIQDVAITQFQYGIDMTGNSGGAFIDMLEMSAYNVGIKIDGSLDTVRINNLQFYNFGLTANQVQIFYDTSCWGITVGRADDIKLSNSLFINGGWALYFSGPSSFGQILNVDFDTNFSVGSVFIGGSDQNIIDFANCYWSAGPTVNNSTQHFISMNGGRATFASCKFGEYFTAGYAIGGAGDIYITNGAKAAFSACEFRRVANTNTNVFIYADNGSYLNVTGCFFIFDTGFGAGTYSNPWISVAVAATANITGNIWQSPIGATPGDAVALYGDVHNCVMGNNFYNWKVDTGGNAPANSLVWPNTLTGAKYALTNATGSRTYGITYTNASPTPMTIMVSFHCPAGSDNTSGYVVSSGATYVVGVTNLANAAGQDYASMTFRVPPFGQYYVLYSSGNAAIIDWIETHC